MEDNYGAAEALADIEREERRIEYEQQLDNQEANSDE